MAQDEKKNRVNFGKSLAQFGYDELSFEDLDFVGGSTDFYIGSGIRLDIFTARIGLEDISFDEALSKANIAQIFDVKVPFFISISSSKIKKIPTGRKIPLM